MSLCSVSLGCIQESDTRIYSIGRDIRAVVREHICTTFVGAYSSVLISLTCFVKLKEFILLFFGKVIEKSYLGYYLLGKNLIITYFGKIIDDSYSFYRTRFSIQNK